MQNQRSKIYGGFIVLWMICAIVLSIQSGIAETSETDQSNTMPSQRSLSDWPCKSISIESSETSEALSVLIYREPKGKRKLEPCSDSTEWQVIYRCAVVAC